MLLQAMRISLLYSNIVIYTPGTIAFINAREKKFKCYPTFSS